MRRFCSLVAASLIALLAVQPVAADDKVTLAHSSISGSQAILRVIQDAGIFKKNGFDVTMIFIAGGPTVIKAMLAGDVPFGVIAGPAAISANLEGADVAVIASFVNTMEHSVFALPDIRQPSDLKGKKFGVSRFGSSDDFGARFALRKWGLEAERDVALIQLGEQPARYGALQAKAVDATLLQPPLTVAARKSRFAELAFLANLGLDYLGTSLITTRSYIRTHEDSVRRMIKAIVEGSHFYKTNRQASLQSIARFMKVQDPEALEETYGQYALRLLSRAPYGSTKGVEVILGDLAGRNPKARSADPSSFVEARFIKELETSGYISKLYQDKK